MVRKSSRECFIQTYLPRFSLVFLFVFGMRDCTRVREQHFPSDQVTLIFLKQRDHFGISACDIFLLFSIYSAGFQKLFKCYLCVQNTQARKARFTLYQMIIRKQIYKFKFHTQTRGNLSLQNFYKTLSVYMYAFKGEMCVDYTIYVFDYCRMSVININFIFLQYQL